MSLFFNYNLEDEAYSLTTAGTVVFIVILIVLIALTALSGKKKNQENEGKKVFSAKSLVFSAAAIALGYVASYIKIVRMPWGGSVTLCSMLFVTLIGYWYGLRTGLAAGFAYSILQFIQGGGSYILSPLQVCMDYIFAFAALGLSGLFHKKPNGLIKGYLLAILARGIFHVIGGYLYWMDYMPDSFPQSLAVIYPFAYNYSFILAEGFITVVILSVPPVKKALARVKEMAVA